MSKGMSSEMIENMGDLELVELYEELVERNFTNEDRQLYHFIVNELLRRMIPVKEPRKEV